MHSLLCALSLKLWCRSHFASPPGTLGLCPPISFHSCLCCTSALILLPIPLLSPLSTSHPTSHIHRDFGKPCLQLQSKGKKREVCTIGQQQSICCYVLYLLGITQTIPCIFKKNFSFQQFPGIIIGSPWDRGRHSSCPSFSPLQLAILGGKVGGND